MTCSRGAASPDRQTQLQLFAASAGFCQDPKCNRALFVDLGERMIHIAEMAHIFGAADAGPRGRADLSREERGRFSNLILLCPSCHTVVDKAPDLHPDAVIRAWKAEHEAKVAALFRVRSLASRAEVRAVALEILDENRAIFLTYGPMTDERFNPESEMPILWRRKVHEHVLPNNRKLLALIDANRGFLCETERRVVAIYRQHVDDFEAKHLHGLETPRAVQFPHEMDQLFGGSCVEG